MSILRTKLKLDISRLAGAAPRCNLWNSFRLGINVERPVSPFFTLFTKLTYLTFGIILELKHHWQRTQRLPLADRHLTNLKVLIFFAKAIQPETCATSRPPWSLCGSSSVSFSSKSIEEIEVDTSRSYRLTNSTALSRASCWSARVSSNKVVGDGLFWH